MIQQLAEFMAPIQQLAEFLAPVFALGFMVGYGMRSIVSHRRRQRYRRG
jgi:hypothetical protein